MALRPAQRVKAFWEAYQSTLNTSMNWVVRRMLSDLYDIELKSETDIRKADEAIKKTAKDPEWPAKVREKNNIQRIFTNNPGHAPFNGLPGVAGVLPRLERPLRGWVERITLAGDQSTELVSVGKDVDDQIAAFAEAGYRGVMTSDEPFDRLRTRTNNDGSLPRTGSTPDEIGAAILHKLCQSAERHGLFIQFFLGIEKGWGSDAGGGGVPSYYGDRLLLTFT